MKTRGVIIINILFLVMQGCVQKQASRSESTQRIVSLAPSITETLFALGLGNRIVGVTSYCVYPAEAKNIENVGGYADANLEKIVAMHPDLVVLSREHEKQRTYLDRFHVRTLTVDDATCASVCSSFAEIGRVCLVTHASDSLIGLFQERLAVTAPTMRPLKVLFCVGRDSPGAGIIKSVYAAARATFYSDLIVAAGGINAFPDSLPAYPRLSPEGILAIAPDVIIDVAPAMGSYACSLLVADWQAMDRIPAVKNKRVYCMSKEYATVPGPRLLLLLDDIRRMLKTEQEGLMQ